MSTPGNTDALSTRLSLTEKTLSLKQSTAWLSTGKAAATLLKNAELRLVLIALAPGKKLQEHHADGAVTILAREGELRVTAAGDTHTLRPGDLLALTREVPHEVEAVAESLLLVTIVGS